MKKLKVLSAVFCMALFWCGNAWAHGGVSIEFDKCVLKIGSYLMHFTGYQPETSGGTEFCEDIPGAGHAIIVMDFVDPQLRKLDTDLKIVQADSWTAAQAYKLGDAAKEVVYYPPKKYKGGSITVDHNFLEPGYFVGIVTAEGDNHEKMASLFPFSVGYGIGAFSGAKGGSATMLLVAAGAAVVILSIGVALFLRSKRRQQGVHA
ncbi:MAG: hypothetical protein ACREVK_06875 [Gammaproteobacteria bacterium]